MRHESFISFSKLAIVRMASCHSTRRSLKTFNKKSIARNNGLNKPTSLAAEKAADAAMTEKEKKFNRVMRAIITPAMRTSAVDEEIKGTADEVAKDITTTVKETLSQRGGAIDANVIMLALNAIAAMKRAMDGVAAKNHASNEKMIEIQEATLATTATTAAAIEISKPLNRL